MKEKENFYSNRFISENGEIFRFLRYRKTPPKEGIKPKRLSFDETANVSYFGEFENYQNLNANKNSVAAANFSGTYNFLIFFYLLFI